MHPLLEKMTWSELQSAFMWINERVGINKSSSGSMTIEFWPNDGEIKTSVGVTFGGYEIGDWNRHEYIGPFTSEKQAQYEAAKKINEAWRIVNEDAKVGAFEMSDFNRYLADVLTLAEVENPYGN